MNSSSLTPITSHSGNGVKLTVAQLMQLIVELRIEMPTESAAGGKKPLKEDYCRSVLEHLFLVQHYRQHFAFQVAFILTFRFHQIWKVYTKSEIIQTKSYIFDSH